MTKIFIKRKDINLLFVSDFDSFFAALMNGKLSRSRAVRLVFLQKEKIFIHRRDWHSLLDKVKN